MASNPTMPNWKCEIRRRLAGLQLAPTRAAVISEELAPHLDDRYAGSDKNVKLSWREQ